MNKRKELDLPEAGSKNDQSTVSLLEIDGQEFYGVNRKIQNPKTDVKMNVNNITKTHAEADAAQQALDAGMKGKTNTATMTIDRDACAACGKNGGLRSITRELGLDNLHVISPSGRKIYTPTKPKK
ncbi:deaminase [Bernardetia sp. Wsw4-3y2]|uniref:deaminase n=1 Tax=Bernardetia sp. Wsw4-3y2 TaxID=3127471 RepID=UPI0030D3BA17